MAAKAKQADDAEMKQQDDKEKEDKKVDRICFNKEMFIFIGLT